MPRTAIQLYTLRDCTTPLSGLLREVAAAGFDGVEFATPFHEFPRREVRSTLTDTVLVFVGAHVYFDTLCAADTESIAQYREAGCRRVIIPHLGIEYLRTSERLADLVSSLSSLEDRLARAGLELGIHTTRELLLPFLGTSAAAPLRIDGLPTGAYHHGAWLATLGSNRTERMLRDRSPLGRIAAGTDRLTFELDAKSIATAGYTFDSVISTLGDRVSLVHVSDVCRSRRIPPDYRPVYPGDGLIDLGALLEATRRHGVEWIVVEHDCPAEPEKALEILAAQFAFDTPSA